MANIGIDLDEVLASHVDTFNQFHDQKYGTDLLNMEITNFYLNELIDITKEEELRRVLEYYDTEFFKIVEPLPGVVEAIKKLSKKNNLYLITSRPKTTRKATEDWIAKYFPGYFKEIIVTNNIVDATKKKSDVCKAKDIDIMVDDSAEYANDCAGVCKKVFLIDRPWNVKEKTSRNVTRVKGWGEILNLLG